MTSFLVFFRLGTVRLAAHAQFIYIDTFSYGISVIIPSVPGDASDPVAVGNELMYGL